MKRLLAALLAALCLLTPLSAAAETTKSTASPTYGDANTDGAINSKDVLTLRKYMADMEVHILMAAADCNGDREVNMKDVLILRMYLAELIDTIDGSQPAAKKVLRSVYHYDADDVNFEINFYTFNAKGNLTFITDREPDGTLIWKKEYTYDNKNREILWVHTEDDERTVMAATTYNAAGRISAVTKTNGGGTVLSKTTFDYNADGNRTAEHDLDANGKNAGKTVYTYNAKKQLQKEESFAADGSLFGYVTYAYDDNGNTSEIKRYGYDKALVGSEKFTYNAAGNLTTHTYLDEKGILDARVDYTYAAKAELETPIAYLLTDGSDLWKYHFSQKNAPQKAVCVSWDGKTVLWSDRYYYTDAT